VPPRLAHILLRAFDALLVLVGAVALLALLVGVVADSRPKTFRAPPIPVAPRVQVAETERDGQLLINVVNGDGSAIGGASLRLFWRQQDRYFDAGQGRVAPRSGACRAARCGFSARPKVTRAPPPSS
jgi:hypothetical protein